MEDFAKAGANSYTFHIEATKDAAALIKKIRAAGMAVGITLRPATPLADILPFVPLVDMVLVMTVNPGFGGQGFMVDQLEKVRELRSAFPSLAIQVDGGIAPETIELAAKAGANVVVSGSAVFKAKDMAECIATLRGAVEKEIKANNKQ